MSSFYGTYGGGSASDYNSLLNTPVTIVEGTQSAPLVLSSLNFGEYLVKGYFVYTSKDHTVKNISYQNYVRIVEDTVTGEKVAIYETVEDGKYYVTTVKIHADETCLVDKNSIKKSDGVTFLSASDLPVKGVEGVLYVTENALYRWNDEDGNYVNMNEPAWETF